MGGRLVESDRDYSEIFRDRKLNLCQFFRFLVFMKFGNIVNIVFSRFPFSKQGSQLEPRLSSRSAKCTYSPYTVL